MARILFVDDDILTLDLMNKVAMLLGHEAILSSSGSAALEAARREEPELILIDFNLPDYTGIEITRLLHTQAGGRPTPPIFILSAGVPAEIDASARQAGAQGCLEKPLGMDTLTRVIKTYTQQ